MLLTNEEIFETKVPLMRILEQKFPVKVSFALAKLASKIQDKLKDIEIVRNQLINTYGENNRIAELLEKVDDKGNAVKGSNGEPVMIPNPVYPKFLEELNELLAIEVEVVFDKVRLPEKVAATCDKCSHNMDRVFEIEPSILMALSKFVTI